MMKVKHALLATVVALGACTEAVILRHPETGNTVKCGPYSESSVANSMREVQCIQDYKEQGYMRVPS